MQSKINTAVTYSILIYYNQYYNRLNTTCEVQHLAFIHAFYRVF